MTGTPTPLSSRMDYNAYGAATNGYLWEFFEHWSREKIGGGYYESIADFSTATGYEKHGLEGIKLSRPCEDPAGRPKTGRSTAARFPPSGGRALY